MFRLEQALRLCSNYNSIASDGKEKALKPIKTLILAILAAAIAASLRADVKNAWVGVNGAT